MQFPHFSSLRNAALINYSLRNLYPIFYALDISTSPHIRAVEMSESTQEMPFHFDENRVEKYHKNSITK